jgi:hypothetical protein
MLFTDVVMPGALDGVELARLFEARRPRPAILLASGFPAGRLPGQSHFPPEFRLLGKPYSLDEMARTIRELLDDPRVDATIDADELRDPDADTGNCHESRPVTDETV